MSASYPGDILPLWNPEIPGEEIQAGRLGIRVRPNSPAAAKLAIIPDGQQWLREVLQEHTEIDGYYQVAKPEKPIEFIGQVDHTLITARLGRTRSGLALEITDMQQLESEYEVEKARLRLGYRDIQLVDQWDGDLEGFTALALREEARHAPILDSTRRFIEHLRDYREQLAEAAIRRYEAVEQWVECPRCEIIIETSNGAISCPECGEDLRGGEYVRAALEVTDGDARVYRGIDSLTVRSPGFPEYRGMTLDRVQGHTLWVSFRRYDPLPDEGVVLPTASVEMFDAQKSVIRQLQIGSPRTGAMAALLADPGWLGSPPQAPLEGRRAHHLPDPNAEQSEAVARVMGMRPGQIYLIQGPPGTGKTTSIVESIRRILGRNHGATILLSSHSNDAVDTGQERLLGFSHVRQARVAEPGKVPRRLRQTLVEGDDLDPYNLVAGTCNRLAIDSRLRFRVFDWLILDEANKVRANEALALMPLAKRWVFIGDVNQLPPVMEDAAMSYELLSDLDRVVRDESFYGWIWDRVPPASRIMLPRQYRMREPIGHVVSDLFYGGRLIHEATHPRMPLPWPFDREVVWVDTGAQEEYRDAQKSVANEFEVALCKDITTIVRKRVRKAKLAVIAMYSSQVNRLVTALRGIVPPDDIESVDAFEGRESDAVILSLVRSNDRAAIGFLNDPNRVNVAVSRARKLLVIVGDSKTVIGGAPELFGPLFQHAKEEGLVAGVGAVVTACQRVGIRSQVQKLSRPRRPKRKRKKRKEQPAAVQVAGDAAAVEPVAEEQPAAAAAEQPAPAAEAEAKPSRRRTRKAAAAPDETAEPAAPAGDEAKPSRRRSAEAPTAESQESPPAETQAESTKAAENRPPRRRSRRTTAQTPAAEAEQPVATEAETKPPRRPRRVPKASIAEAKPAGVTEAEAKPAAETGSAPAAETGSAPAVEGGSAPAAEVGPAPAAETGSAPAAEAGPAPTAETESAPAAEAGSARASEAGPAPAAETESAPAAEAGSAQAAEAGPAPAETGSAQAAETGSAPAAEAGSAPAAETGSKPTADAGPAVEAESAAGAGIGSEPVEETGSTPGAEAGVDVPGEQAEAKPARRRTKAAANVAEEGEAKKPVRRRTTRAAAAESKGTAEPDPEHQLQVIDTRVELSPAPRETPRPRARRAPRRRLQQEDLPLDIPQAGD